MPAKIRKYVPTVLKLLLIFLIAAGFAAFWYFNTLPDRADAQQTIVIGPTRFAPDSEASLRVVVQGVGNGQPVSGAAVQVSLKPEAGGPATPLFEGTTDESGTLPVSFRGDRAAVDNIDIRRPIGLHAPIFVLLQALHDELRLKGIYLAAERGNRDTFHSE